MVVLKITVSKVILPGKFFKMRTILPPSFSEQLKYPTLLRGYYLTATKTDVHLSHQQRKEAMLDEIILNSGGKFVTVTFTKKDGSLRTLTGRMGVTKHLKGGVSTLNADQYVTIYDIQNNGYRAVNRSTIQSVKCEGVTHE